MIARLDAKALAAHVQGDGLIVDLREPPMFADAHLLGSLNVALSNRSAPYWLNALTSERDRIAVVTATAAEAASAAELLEAAERTAIGTTAFDATSFAKAGLAIATIRTITPDELADEAGTVVLDVRERDEWIAGHVPGALWIPLDELRSRRAEVPSGRTAVICASGFRSSAGASLLEAAGRRDLANVWGGTTAWQQLGLPVNRGREP